MREKKLRRIIREEVAKQKCRDSGLSTLDELESSVKSSKTTARQKIEILVALNMAWDLHPIEYQRKVAYHCMWYDVYQVKTSKKT